jgi:predicted small lipoprotein YifL
MFGVHQILVSTPPVRAAIAAGAIALLAACGQKGPLVLPTGEAAAGRASLPDTLSPSGAEVPPTRAGSSIPPSGTASPIRQP